MFFSENPLSMNDTHGNSLTLSLKEREDAPGRYRIMLKFNDIEFNLKYISSKREAIFQDKMLVKLLKQEVKYVEIPTRSHKVKKVMENEPENSN